MLQSMACILNGHQEEVPYTANLVCVTEHLYDQATSAVPTKSNTDNGLEQQLELGKDAVP